ncbi:MAG: cell division FtsA domain-containing protein [Halieaceae bacterium]
MSGSDTRYSKLSRLFHWLTVVLVLTMVPAGIVLTGGTSKMEGVMELAEEIFHMPVRVGYPQSVQGLTDIVRNPIYATGVGLLQYGLQHADDIGSGPRSVASGESWFDRAKSWVQSNF